MEMEWSPTEPGILACTSLHDMFTFWDYSEPPIPKKEHEITLRDGKVVHVPGQMQFLDERFEYSQDFHWHPQLPNVIVFYARNMFNFGIKRRQ
jgi:hypothetical protein